MTENVSNNITINISGDVDDDMLDKLVDNHSKLKEGYRLTVYLSSGGGYVHTKEAIIDFINRNRGTIYLITYGELYSAAFDIAMKARCEKIILPETLGMVHISYTAIEMDESGKAKTDYGKFCLDEMKKTKVKTIEFLRTLGLTPAEIKKVSKGEDVFLTHERLAEIFENSKTV